MVRIATFNLENLGGERARAQFAARAEILRPQIERLRADVLCAQEVNARKQGASRRAEELEELLAPTSYGAHAITVSSGASGKGPADIHNLAVISRLAVLGVEDLRHKLVMPALYRRRTAEPPDEAHHAIEWERPIQHVSLQLAGGSVLHLFNVHLRAPLAANVPGQKSGPFAWKSVPGWAEGFFLSAVQRAGQALELRLAIDAVFDVDPEALIAVCGDFNAQDHDTALRIACAGEDDTGSGALAGRVLTPVARSLPADRRFTVLHHGRPEMLDHILASRALLGRLDHVEIHNETLDDELVAYGAIDHPPDSLHAPLLAVFNIA